MINKTANYLAIIIVVCLFLGLSYSYWSMASLKSGESASEKYSENAYLDEYNYLKTGDPSDILKVASRAYPYWRLPAPEKSDLFEFIDFCFYEYLIREAAIRGSDTAIEILKNSSDIVHTNYPGAATKTIFRDSNFNEWQEWEPGTPYPPLKNSILRYQVPPFREGGGCPAVTPIYGAEYFRFKRSAIAELERQNLAAGRD